MFEKNIYIYILFFSIGMSKNKWSKIDSLVQTWVEDEDPNLLVVYLPKSRNSRQQVICKGSLRLMDVITPDFIDKFTETAYRKAPYVPTIREVLPAITKDVVQTNTTVKRHLLSDITQKYMTKKKKISRGYWGNDLMKPEFWPEDVPFKSPSTNKATGQCSLCGEEMNKVLLHYVSWKNALQPSNDNSPSTNDNVQQQDHANESLCDFLIDGNIEVLQCEVDQGPTMYTAVPVSSQPQTQTEVRWKITPNTRFSYDNEVHGTHGLYNLNNNCWLNSALQSLKQIKFPELDRNSLDEDSTITKVMKLIVELQQPVPTKVNHSVEHILDSLHFDDAFGDTDKGMQQDPCNFLETVLQKLMRKGLFQLLQIKNTLKCRQCEVERTGSKEPLPILFVDACRNETLQDSVDRFFHEEIMEGSESVNCRHCKQATQHIRTSMVCEEPSTLVLQIKRFNPITYQKSMIPVKPSRQIIFPVHTSNYWELSAVIMSPIPWMAIKCFCMMTYLF
ncbi:ubiquitin carboxyl-terminal hydrolase 24-like isoform X3 [Mytilus californianus]|uniref:ubiquitin carboxyl-terminal hydrolase 24-like isoform X2 n=1 Tax=Mytilus californianus TaxID=6549 RepID=UPI002247BD88|nr:ubiquitin carboxyl-terminal hydrolase 24-like isoform X2 [Mytilus californianus]XP_052100677.1 ubiquitin carboxyl-terminal hydrolase 24-like isoform X3 [Mytilus californianus]